MEYQVLVMLKNVTRGKNATWPAQEKEAILYMKSWLTRHESSL